MMITPKRIHIFMLFKLPLGWLSGLRVKVLNDSICIVKIRHRWINQNPFKSMFWAAQGMAAEMSTATLVMQAIEQSQEKVSMLVTKQEAQFYKKATGTVLFTCKGGKKIQEAILMSKKTTEGQLISLVSEGRNEDEVVVSRFSFVWSIKVKQ